MSSLAPWTSKKMSKLPANIRVTTAFLSDIDVAVKELFVHILCDYVHRLNLKLTKKKVNIGFCGIEMSKDKETMTGLTICTEERILVQVGDPYIDADFTDHYYIATMFVVTLCHEMVHVCQHLTREDNTKKPITLPHDSQIDQEKYFFDPEEVEARILESFYAHRFAHSLIKDMEVDNGKTIRSGNGRIMAPGI